MGIHGYIGQDEYKRIVNNMQATINSLEECVAQMVAPHDLTGVSEHNDLLKDENTKLRIALQKIYEKSEDNWAAAVAQTALGCGKIATY